MITSKGKSKYSMLLAHLGAVITVSAWGSSFICTKVLMQDGGFTPVEVYVYRFALAYLLLLTFTFKKIFSNNWKDEVNFLICGICAGSLYFITENYALFHTSTSNVSLLASISPIFTTILMAIVFKERIKSGVIIGSIIAFAGVACIIFSSGEGFEIKPKGDLLALTAAFSWAIYTIVVKKLIPIYNSFFITRKLFFYGTLTALPLLFAQEAPYHINLLWDLSQPEYMLNLLFLVAMCSVMAYLVWNETMKNLGPVTANNYLYGQPLVTMIIAAIVLGESINFLGYTGCVLIIGGLIISDKLQNGIRFIKK